MFYLYIFFSLALNAVFTGKKKHLKLVAVAEFREVCVCVCVCVWYQCVSMWYPCMSCTYNGVLAFFLGWVEVY